jgi:hypothetical protein
MMTEEKGTGPFDQDQYAAEAREQWGDTEAYKISALRTKNFSKEDWARIQAETEEVEARLAEVFLAGHAPSDEASMEAAEAHRLQIENFYPCSHAMHVGLGQMYTVDPRFSEHYDKRAGGLAAFVQAAIEANARRAGWGS